MIYPEVSSDGDQVNDNQFTARITARNININGHYDLVLLPEDQK